MLTPKETGSQGGIYPVDIPYSVLCKYGYGQAPDVAESATIALGFKPTAVDTAYPLCDPTSHYLLTIRKVGTTVTVWKQDVNIGSYTSTATNYAALLGEALEQYSGAYIGYLSRLVIVEEALNYASFYTQSGKVPGLWVMRMLPGLSIHTMLDFTNAANLGADSSGNGHNWTFVDSVQSVDTPTNNCCTLHPLDPATTGSLSDGNLTTTGDAKVTLRPESGKWYYEKDGVGVSYDAGVSGQFNPVLTAGTYNFGGAAWDDAGPGLDESPIRDAGLPEPAVLNVDEHYFGATFVAPVGAAQDIVVGWDAEASGFGLRLKRTDAAENWHLISDVTGLGYEVQQGSNGSLDGRTALATAVMLSGNTITVPADLLTAGGTYLVEVFRRGVESGFNVVTYTGDGVAGLQVPHGLGTAPFFVMAMSNDASGRYKPVWNRRLSELGAAAYFNANVSTGSSLAASVWNATPPDAVNVTVGANVNLNGSGAGYALWCWSDVGVYREVGFLGNGSANGPFNNMGGTPLAFPMWKDCSTGPPVVSVPATITPYNPVDKCLVVSDRISELAVTPVLARSSVGYKAISNSTGWNAINHLIVGIAVAGNNKYRNAF